ncbi:MAG: HAD family hydrolase [Chloroflexi bacterium]|nr:HAD family hydrolase [Chloroflexota bacterium]
MTATDSHSPFDPSRIRAVAFDGYGTLLSYGMSDFRLEVASILVDQRIDVDLDEFFPTWQRSYRLGDVWDQADREVHGPTGWPTDRALNGPLPPWHSQWEIWRRQFQAALDHHGLDGDATDAANRFRRALSDANAYIEAHDALEALATRGYLLGLLSNADEDFLQSAVSRARLRFSVIQSSESLRAYKPHRAIFNALADRFAVSPQEILYVGDSPFADVAGAANAGLRTAWIRRNDASLPEHIRPPDVTIALLTELLDLLEGHRQEQA